jgi:hypothetical protein
MKVDFLKVTDTRNEMLHVYHEIYDTDKKQALVMFA